MSGLIGLKFIEKVSEVVWCWLEVMFQYEACCAADEMRFMASFCNTDQTLRPAEVQIGVSFK